MRLTTRGFPCALLLLLCCLCQDARGTCPAGLPRSAIERSGSCYQFVDRELTWVNARAYCRNGGGKMVTVDDKRVQEWLVERIGQLGWKSNGVWIGLNDRQSEGHFSWDSHNGTEVMSSFSNWNAGEPGGSIFDQDCVYMRRQYGWRWVDVECDLNLFRTYNFICQYRGMDSLLDTTTLAQSRTYASDVVSTKSLLPQLDVALKSLSDGISPIAVVDGVARFNTFSNDTTVGEHRPQADVVVSAAGDSAAYRSDEVKGVNNNAYMALVAGAGTGLLVALLVVAGVMVMVWQLRWRKGGGVQDQSSGVMGMDNPVYLHGTSAGDRGSRLQLGGVVLAA